jgi:hypothetical protein
MAEKPRKKYTVRERVDEVYRRLGRLPRPTSAEAALCQLCDTLEQVEDEMSGIKKQIPTPPPSSPDGRMYCPLDDNILRRPDGSILAKTRGHTITISNDGHLQIVNRASQRVEFEK